MDKYMYQDSTFIRPGLIDVKYTFGQRSLHKIEDHGLVYVYMVL